MADRSNTEEMIKCRACPATGKQSRENLLSEFDKASRVVEFARVLGPLTAMWYRHHASTICRSAPSADRILDLGIGPGHLIGPLGRRYPKSSIVGIDKSRPMLNLASTAGRPDDLGSRVRFVQASFYALPFREQTFDLVTATGILHHVNDLELFFHEVRRVISPGGRFVACAFRRDVAPLVRMLARAHSAWMRYRGSSLEGFYWVLKASWTRREIENALHQAGFAGFVVWTKLARLRTIGFA